ncbi:3-isopropylmalate dehydratase small subunit [Corynebacterium mendelii]|uniref:3-isopropylmalate dehydratase small subunit n=1 Tax=Corynebacterium mendelii TaxID=2765362 RepID=A0A939E194_9CORY|nr:3-isopropylmalate dehydratase small subunit [Corynebacterium mendelii]MBN9644606.1 3-isopropylmalate dehydratase small subunit [Corynebacterium mendelii]
MQPITTVTGIGVPLPYTNIDTDQILPAVYLKRVTRTGFEDALFETWRKDPDFILNTQPYCRGTILVAGEDFGTGSSREHAVWALTDYGFKVVLSPRFGDIFRGNAGKNGLLAGVISEHTADRLFSLLQRTPGLELTVDLDTRTVTAGGERFDFDVDDYTRWRLMEGLDDIGLTLRDEEAISAYENKRQPFYPVTTPAGQHHS